MLTYEDCLALAELGEDEVEAIAGKEHPPETAVRDLEPYLVRTPEGETHVKAAIRGDVEAARARGDLARAARLKLALKHYLATHTGAARHA